MCEPGCKTCPIYTDNPNVFMSRFMTRVFGVIDNRFVSSGLYTVACGHSAVFMSEDAVVLILNRRSFRHLG